jgi:hypothetical protein
MQITDTPVLRCDLLPEFPLSPIQPTVRNYYNISAQDLCHFYSVAKNCIIPQHETKNKQKKHGQVYK